MTRSCSGGRDCTEDLRTAERAFLDTGDERHLDRAEDLVQGCLREAPFAHGTRLWLSLLRYDRAGDDRHLDIAVRGAGEAVPAGNQEIPLWLTPAWRAIDIACTYLERGRLHNADDDLLTARGILHGAIRAARQPAIRALGLRHLAACEQELYLRHGSRRLLDQAIRRYERALAITGKNSVLRPMLLTELAGVSNDHGLLRPARLPA